uniref:hypothetical protein n=1 Tax=Pararhizobium sp. IMCC3301 TaxID=3067904 RepID=UPI002740F7A5|nr:hypothetical protein [Pararhizobium sp. IMCC3301]
MVQYSLLNGRKHYGKNFTWQRYNNFKKRDLSADILALLGTTELFSTKTMMADLKVAYLNRSTTLLKATNVSYIGFWKSLLRCTERPLSAHFGKRWSFLFQSLRPQSGPTRFVETVLAKFKTGSNSHPAAYAGCGAPHTT